MRPSLPFVSGGAAVSEPKAGAQEQPAVHLGPAARHLPAPAHCPVKIRGEDGDAGRKRVFQGVHGELDEENEADHKPLQGGQRENV